MWKVRFQENGFWWVLYGRLFPFSNSTVMSLLCGSCKVGFLPFLFGSFIGFVPLAIVFAAFGSGGMKGNGLQIGSASILLVLSVLFRRFMKRWFRAKKMDGYQSINGRSGKAVMRSFFHISICSLTIALSVLAVAAQGKRADGKTEDTREVINYLIEEVKSSHLTFIRNGRSYSGEQAAEHVRTKYRHFKSQIETPEDFIRLCATKSLISGKPYLVVTPKGTMEVSRWLEEVLLEYRRNHGQHGPG